MAKQVDKEKLKKDFIRYISTDFKDIDKRDIPAIDWILDQKGIPKNFGQIKCHYGDVRKDDNGKGIILEYIDDESKNPINLRFDRRTIEHVLERYYYFSENAMIKKPEDNPETLEFIWYNNLNNKPRRDSI